MLDRNFILKNIDYIKQNIKNRNIDIDLDKFLELDKKRGEIQQKIDSLRHKRKQNAEKIRKIKDKSEEQILIQEGKRIKNELNKLEEEHRHIEKQYYEIYLKIPNITHPQTPIGKDETDNQEIFRYDIRKTFDFKIKDHLQLGKDLDILDFEKGSKVAGSNFYYTKNELVLLEFGLIQFVLDKLINKYNFIPLVTPDIAKLEIIEGTGFNPRGDEKQVYIIEDTNLGLIGTSEITVAGYHKNEVFQFEELPLKYVAFSHCFRNEAGAYGKYSKGLYRVHQFSKVEMFIFCKQEDSDKMLEELKMIESEIYTDLEIPFRIVDVCTGDLGAPAYRKYDFEAWLYGREGQDPKFQGNWGEITSASNCLDYQARRLNIKYIDENGKKQFVHTLNGTAIAFTRVPIAILEHYQQKDGSVIIPEILHKYIHIKKICPKK